MLIGNMQAEFAQRQLEALLAGIEIVNAHIRGDITDRPMPFLVQISPCLVCAHHIINLYKMDRKRIEACIENNKLRQLAGNVCDLITVQIRTQQNNAAVLIFFGSELHIPLEIMNVYCRKAQLESFNAAMLLHIMNQLAEKRLLVIFLQNDS